MALPELTENLNVIQSLADKPALTAEELKRAFDEAVNKIKTYTNEVLLPALNTNIASLQNRDASLSAQITNTNTALTEQGTELNTKINNNAGTLTQAQLNKIYPVGAIYMSTVNTNPSSLFGGSWTQIKDRFLLASGDAYANGTTGGNANHVHTNPNTGSYTGTTGNYSGNTGSTTLTVNQIPSHTHAGTTAEGKYGSLRAVAGVGNSYAGNHITGYANSDYKDYPNAGTSHTHTFTTNATGGNQGHTHSIPSHNHSMTHSHTIGNTGSSSNMPPYFTVYMWRRTA